MSRDYSLYIKGHIPSDSITDMIKTVMRTEINIFSMVLLLIKSVSLFILSGLLSKSIAAEKEIDRQISDGDLERDIRDDVNV